MKLSHLGIFGSLSLLSYGAMVFFSPLAYPGYDWMSMAVSDLSAVGVPSRELAAQLNSLFGPCAVVSIMAVCVAIRNCEEKLLRSGVYLFAAMEWLCTVGYGCFPWISDAQGTNIQNIMHILVHRIISNRHINLSDFSSASLSSINVATATPHSSALHMK